MTAAHLVTPHFIDDEGKPKAGKFDTKQAPLAVKAAEQLKMKVLPVVGTKLGEIVSKIPAGRVHASGKGFIGSIRRELYAKLLEAAAGEGSPSSPQQSPGGNGSTGDGANSNGNGPVLPRDWDTIAIGHVVVAQEGPEDGWYEAVVTQRSGDMLSLRWRNFPREPRVTQHRRTVALMYTEAYTTPVGSPATPTNTPAKKPRDVSKPETMPTTWHDIDIDHLVLAKDDGPWGTWFEAIVVTKAADQLTVRWRDFPQSTPIVRHRHNLALLNPRT